MPTFLRFVWIAFVEYWGVWVTGTGIVGLALFLLGLAQTVTGWKMKPRHYVIVLFCVFWFLATFSAWHDADKNLTNVEGQRQNDTTDLEICRAKLETSQSSTEFFEKQADMNLTNFNVQQSTLNAW